MCMLEDKRQAEVPKIKALLGSGGIIEECETTIWLLVVGKTLKTCSSLKCGTCFWL